MNVPRNVVWFEVLLYMSLTLDAVSVAFQDRTPTAKMTEQMIATSTLMAAGLILPQNVPSNCVKPSGAAVNVVERVHLTNGTTAPDTTRVFC